MRSFIYAGLIMTLVANCGGAFGADKAYTFTIKGKAGMEFRSIMVPKGCIKKINKQWHEISCTAPVEPIDLQLGPPMTMTGNEYTFDLIAGIKQYAQSYKTAEYPIEKYWGVCVGLLRKPEPAITKCGPIGGSVEF